MTSTAELESLLQALVGQPCWGVIPPTSAGEPLVLQCGEKLRRALRLANPKLSFVHRTYEGSARVTLDCPWRLSAARGLLTSSVDPSREEPPPLLALEGEVIEEISARGPALDLVLRFSRGFVLECFSARVDGRAARFDWGVSTPAGSASVRLGRAELESAERAARRLVALKERLQGEEAPVLAPVFARGEGGPPPRSRARKGAGKKAGKRGKKGTG